MDVSSASRKQNGWLARRIQHVIDHSSSNSSYTRQDFLNHSLRLNESSEKKTIKFVTNVTCLRTRFLRVQPIVGFDMDGAVEEFAEDRHPGMVMKGD